jgi:DNA-binding transcriptional regulator LsrR (DeoR family)
VHSEPRRWMFFSNHVHVLVCVAKEPDVRIRDISQKVGITERAAQGILNDLEEGGYVSISRNGRRNHYRVHPDLPFRHPLYRDIEVGQLLNALVSREGESKTSDPMHKVGRENRG